jgi:multidrug efflux system membrane fusion protein
MSFRSLAKSCFGLMTISLALAGCTQNQAAPARDAVPVMVATVELRDVPVEVRAIGNVQPYSTVQIKSQVSAQLERVHFKEGQDVKKGQLLFTLDRRQLEADLKKLEGQVARDQAQLLNSQAKATRYTQLHQEGVVSQQDYDAAIADAEAIKASLAADRAAVDSARVQLNYTSIFSPIDGRTGGLQVYEGNLVKANDVPILVTINQVSPIYVEFALPEQQLAQVKQFSAGKKLLVKAVIDSDKRNPSAGELSFIDNAVDSTTGTIKMKATFTNQDRRLWPGQFVDVVLTLSTQPNAVVVPSAAVQTGQQGQYVYVVQADKAINRDVSVSGTYGTDSIVASGLQPGEKVVTDGQVRLKPGDKVAIKNGQSGTINASHDAPAATAGE